MRPGGSFRQGLNLRLEAVELVLGLGDLRALHHEVRPEGGRDEDTGADPDEHGRARKADGLLVVITREQIDGAHASVLDSQADGD